MQESAREDMLTGEILSRLPGIPTRIIPNPDSVLADLHSASDPHTSAKRTLILTRFPGKFMKECPGAGAEVCCNYFVVNFASNCHLECTYCVLQSYLTNPAMMVFTNAEELMQEVEGRLCASPLRTFRIGTGEMADSLALDSITHYTRLLVPLFARLPNGILELKTKSDQIANLEHLEHRGHTVVSWSVNSRRICQEEELKTASLEERLQAARRCQEWGYRIGFHFDPLIFYEGWEEEYEDAVRLIFKSVDPAGISWISLGALRFTPRLRDIMRERFPKSRIPYGEFVPGHHGKLRYFRPIREEMYEKMRGWIRREASGVFVYLCMENRAAWLGGFGESPRDTSDLSDRMDALVNVDPL